MLVLKNWLSQNWTEIKIKIHFARGKTCLPPPPSAVFKQMLLILVSFFANGYASFFAYQYLPRSLKLLKQSQLTKHHQMYLCPFDRNISIGRYTTIHLDIPLILVHFMYVSSKMPLDPFVTMFIKQKEILFMPSPWFRAPTLVCVCCLFIFLTNQNDFVHKNIIIFL